MLKESKKLHNAFTEEELELIRKVYADTPNKVIGTDHYVTEHDFPK